MTFAPQAARSVSVDATPQRLSSAGSSTCDDSAALHYMLTRLYQYARHMGDMLMHALPNTVYLREPDGRQHRIVLMNAGALQPDAELTFVGFFGQKRPGVDFSALDALDQELIQEFRDYPHLLSYSSLELVDGTWGNLVVMTGSHGLVSWAGSARHAHASQEFAPRCYLTIRLHRGTFTAANSQQPALQIQSTKHFDFTQSAS